MSGSLPIYSSILLQIPCFTVSVLKRKIMGKTSTLLLQDANAGKAISILLHSRLLESLMYELL